MVKQGFQVRMMEHFAWHQLQLRMFCLSFTFCERALTHDMTCKLHVL